jgi:hypothetical protein
VSGIEEGQRRLPIGGHIHRQAHAVQATAQCLTQAFGIIDDQYSHVGLLVEQPV